LKKFNEWNKRGKSIAELYLKELKYISNIILPFVADWADPIWHLFVVRTKERETLQHYFSKHGIQTLIHYPIPPHKQNAYNEIGDSNLPVSEIINKEILILPIEPAIADKDVYAIIGSISC
jgi:dTDP-4-amino-4,6-dideoxygalactose transaminase